jgi:hypothetical protein
MNYALEMGSGAMICIPSFVKIGSAIQNLIGGYTDTQTVCISHNLILILFIKIRKVGQKFVNISKIYRLIKTIRVYRKATNSNIILGFKVYEHSFYGLLRYDRV